MTFFIAILAVSVSQNSLAAVDEECLAQLKSSGVQAWQRQQQESLARAYNGTLKGYSKYKASGKVQQIDKDQSFSVKRHGESRCALVRWGTGGDRHIESVNPEYRFRLTGTSSEDEWMLARAGTPPAEPVISRNAFWYDEYSWRIGGGAQLEAIVSRPDLFQIDEAQFVVNESGLNVVRLKATNLEKKFDHHGSPAAVSTAELDPDCDWSIVSYTIESAKNEGGGVWTTSGKIAYETDANGECAISSITETRHSSETDFDPDEEVIISFNSIAPLDDTEAFYLPHYGIDDSAIRGDTRGRLWRFGYFLAGVVALVIAWRVLKGRAASTNE